MKLYHCTTPKKLERYKNTGMILPPVRGWKYINSAKEWSKKTQRTVLIEFECTESYPLPDHKPLYHSYWTPEHIKNYKILTTNQSYNTGFNNHEKRSNNKQS